MGYVVRDIVDGLWESYGRPDGNDWEQFLAWCGAKVVVTDLPDASVPGFVHGSTIFLHRHLSIEEIARTAYHEVAHFLIHDGDVRWWRTRPQGHITVAKFERQAEEFARTFPDWGRREAV